MNATARLSTTKPEAAAQLLELIQMRLISEAIHVAAERHRYHDLLKLVKSKVSGVCRY
jgi:hypothetical protein